MSDPEDHPSKQRPQEEILFSGGDLERTIEDEEGPGQDWRRGKGGLICSRRQLGNATTLFGRSPGQLQWVAHLQGEVRKVPEIQEGVAGILKNVLRSCEERVV
jgi:hypothetical protein